MPTFYGGPPKPRKEDKKKPTEVEAKPKILEDNTDKVVEDKSVDSKDLTATPEVK